MKTITIYNTLCPTVLVYCALLVVSDGTHGPWLGLHASAVSQPTAMTSNRSQVRWVLRTCQLPLTEETIVSLVGTCQVPQPGIDWPQGTLGLFYLCIALIALRLVAVQSNPN